MNSNVRRIFVRKKKGFDVEAKKLYKEFTSIMKIDEVVDVKILNRYDIQGISKEDFEKAKNLIFSEPPVDTIFEEDINIPDEDKYINIEYLPGQYDQRADSAVQSIQLISGGEKINIKTAKVIIISGDISEDNFKRIKEYCINPVESREASSDKLKTLDDEIVVPDDVEIIYGFRDMSDQVLEEFLQINGLAMSYEDLKFCRDYFIEENKDPTITEIKLIDTYWSDHCRHTTFLTKINNIEFEKGKYANLFKSTYDNYIESRKYVYEDRKDKDVCLMDLATIAMKELRKKGELDDLEVSDEINAASIVVNVDINGEKEEWLVMFKNETHNHPTEIEPFGGAATCLGGAIRDPLSGRSYVYQAMRVTGSGDPRTRIKDTMPGKLPQRKITKGAAEGYSSYGNQIGLATGQVHEIYDKGYVAKRMEIGAVIAAAPKENVKRLKPSKDDIIILLGGRTGRDGCGGATGSSKEHDEESLNTCGAEVQKGNPPTERKIQRLFRKNEVSSLIKKCNDFGAGGVSVAVGELADSLSINLDKVLKKYEGLDGTELAISESQERMAVLIDKNDLDIFLEEARKENLEAEVIAEVTDNKRLIMTWRGKTIVDLKREFLDTNGVKQEIDIKVLNPDEKSYFSKKNLEENKIKDKWMDNLQDLNICSQKGLVEMFDSTIGAGTILMPYGGKYQLSPAEGMAAKIPVLKGETNTATLMSFGYNPQISKWSPYHGAIYSVIESVTKIVAMGGDYKKIRFAFQEYFEKLGKDKEKWGKPFSALLGAFYAQNELGLPAIGGKDSMSGTFKDLCVPPTLVSFAVCTTNSNNVISTEFKKVDSDIVLIKATRDNNDIPDFNTLKKNYEYINSLINEGKVLSAHSIRNGGIAEAITKMSLGNKIGVSFDNKLNEELFSPCYGSIIIEVDSAKDLLESNDIEIKFLGKTINEKNIIINDEKLNIDKMIDLWMSPLENIFPTTANVENKEISSVCYKGQVSKSKIKIAKPRVFIPVFPGTNCEYDTEKAFINAGGEVNSFVFKNLSKTDIEESINKIVNYIKNSQIIMIPGGFSLGDEPDGSGKFIAAVFRNPYIKEAISELLDNRDGLMLGICNGFQALIKLGLLPYGKICEINENSPTLTYNSIGRHVSCMVNTKIVSNKSPWLNMVEVGDIHSIPVSHGEGRFVANKNILLELYKNGQVATKYVDLDGNSSYKTSVNPNGSNDSIEGITSPDGRVFGKMGHSERIGINVYKNIPGEKDQKIFKSGIEYYI